MTSADPGTDPGAGPEVPAGPGASRGRMVRQRRGGSSAAAGPGDPAEGAGDPAEGAGDPAEGAGDPAERTGDPAEGTGVPAEQAVEPEARRGRSRRSGRRWRHWLADHGLDGRLLLMLPALLFVIGLFVYPFLYGLGLSFEPAEGGGYLANYRRFFTDAYQRDTIHTTLLLAVPVSLANVLASVPIAYRMRGRFRGKRLITTALVVPITLGTVLTAEGLLNFLGPAGWFNRALLATGVVDEPLRLTNNYYGVFFSMIITGFPFAFLLVLSYLSGIDPVLERAAATLGAGHWARFRRVTLPLLVPGLATTFCLSFVLAFSVFPSAILVGDPAGTTRVISIAAYQAAYEQYDYSFASTVAMIMGAVEVVVIGAVLLWRSRFYVGMTGGKG